MFRIGTFNAKWACDFIRSNLFAFVAICTLLPVRCTAQYVKNEIGIVHGYIGESVTLVCDLGNIYDYVPIYWYDVDRERFISSNEYIYFDKNRVSVTCERNYPDDRCSLTIDPVTSSDNGTYVCGYIYDRQAYPLDAGYLIASYGDLPSGNSPICETYVRTYDKMSEGDYEYKPPTSREAFSVGDELALVCVVEDSTLSPSIKWIREQGNVSNTVAQSSEDDSLRYQLTLTAEDTGIKLTCVMIHPALPEPRNCSIAPLLKIPTTSVATTSPSASTGLPDVSTSTLITTVTETDHPGVSESNTYQGMPSYILPVIISIVVILAAIAIIALLILLNKRRRNKKNVIPAKPNYELTYDRDRDCSITPEYAAVNAPDSIDKALELKSTARTSPPNANDDAAEAEDSFPVYAKPDKKKDLNNGESVATDDGQYENFSHTAYSEESESNSQEGLMYADLDLPASDSNSPRKPPGDQDVTVYADIQGTL